jgi:suppressor for copper-sensitivity B
LAAALVVPGLWRAPPAAQAAAGPWRAFDRAAIAGLVAEGRVVFVDVTAAWCLTCQVNEKLVLGQEPVAAALRGAQVVAMRADWTRPDAAIAQYLQSFGRYGIPFYAVYGPHAPEGLPLAEIVTPDQVTQAIQKAGAPQQATAARP